MSYSVNLDTLIVASFARFLLIHKICILLQYDYQMALLLTVMSM